MLGDEAVGMLNVEEFIAEVFGALGYKDGKRFFNMGDDPETERLMKVIEELKSALEGKQMELDAKMQIEQMKGDVKLEDRARQNAAMMAREILSHDGAISIEHLRQAGEAGQMTAQMIERDHAMRFNAAEQRGINGNGNGSGRPGGRPVT